MDAAGNKIYAVDFDGTLSQGVPFPEVGTPNKPLIDFLLREKAAGARIILYTCRTARDLKAAVVFCQENGLYKFLLRGILCSTPIRRINLLYL